MTGMLEEHMGVYQVAVVYRVVGPTSHPSHIITITMVTDGHKILRIMEPYRVWNPHNHLKISINVL